MSEHRLQVSFIQYLRVEAKPEVLYFSVPNGGLRNVRVAQALKNEGLLPGVADLCFLLPDGLTAWLELKFGAGRLSDHQIGFKTRCEALGHKWAVANSLEAAIEAVRKWGVLK